jgi:hypothetical protein
MDVRNGWEADIDWWVGKSYPIVAAQEGVAEPQNRYVPVMIR